MVNVHSRLGHTKSNSIILTVQLCMLLVQVEKSFKMKRGYRDGLKHQKGRNNGSLHSKDAQSYMTPSLYLCFIVHKQSLI